MITTVHRYSHTLLFPVVSGIYIILGEFFFVVVFATEEFLPDSRLVSLFFFFFLSDHPESDESSIMTGMSDYCYKSLNENHMHGLTLIDDFP